MNQVSERTNISCHRPRDQCDLLVIFKLNRNGSEIRLYQICRSPSVVMRSIHFMYRGKNSRILVRTHVLKRGKSFYVSANVGGWVGGWGGGERQYERDSPKLGMWCGLPTGHDIGTFFPPT
jgi:hypothetical protein